MFFMYTKRRYQKLNELNNYLDFICAGNFDLDIAANTEGELSILQNNLFKVITLLKTQNEKLELDKVLLADALADISHQLKTPLTSMMVMNDLAKIEQNEEKRQEFFEITTNQLEKMHWLISNLLKISKLESGNIQLVKTSVCFDDLIEESLKPFLVTLDLKNISVIKNIDDFNIECDNRWTVEAIQNIVKNCIEHTNKNGRLAITTSNNNLYNQLVIADNGCGIANEDLPYIFERFYHGKNASDDSVGIGLALAKTVLEKQKATIEVQSTQGVGTTFTIKFFKSIF